MPNTYEGNLIGAELKIGVAVSRFNSFITTRLLDGALDALKRHGVDLNDVDTFWTPGSFEIPATAKRLAESNRYDAVICIGAVIRGATPHFDFVANESAKGIAQISFNTGVPVIYGIITTDTRDLNPNRWHRPNEVREVLERRWRESSPRGAELPDVGPFIARQDDLPEPVRRSVVPKERGPRLDRALRPGSRSRAP